MPELHDYRNGKEQPWREKKLANIEYADLLAMLQYYKVKRVSHCADVLKFAVTETGHLKLKQTWFCKARLCPMCMWRRSKVHAVSISKIIEEAVKRYPNGRWLFVTLTTKNTMNADDLSEEIANYSKAFRSMLKRKKLKDSVLGFFRAIEVTVNKENGSYNQHVHGLIFVKTSYFKSKDRYVSQSEWIELWQKAMKLNYKPSVDIRAVKGNDKHELFHAILEVAKYPVKSFDYLTGELDDNLKALEDLEQALYRKRLIGYGGVLKDIQKELNIADVESEAVDLVVTGEEVEKERESGREITAVWEPYRKKYFVR